MSNTATLEAPVPPAQETLPHPGHNKTIILSGGRMWLAALRIWLTILSIAIKNYRSPLDWIKVLKGLENNRKKYLGDHPLRKIAKAGGRYYYDLYAPGYPSIAFNKYFEGEMNRMVPIKKKCNRFVNAFVALTKKCPLQCEHCFEWDELNKKETLTKDDLHLLVSRFQELGLGQIQFGGGEPMMRLNDLAEIVAAGNRDLDFWIVTSGYLLNTTNAARLKQAGLRGVIISLDHYDEAAHNKFRGSDKSYRWVMQAVRSSLDAGLVTALTLCVTRNMANKTDLLKYAELAKELGVAFVQLVEPKASGRYREKDVRLSTAQEKLVEEVNFSLSYDKQYSDFPLMSYHGHYQRRTGCFGAGNRHLYTNTNGQIQACPFCQLTLGSALDADYMKIINGMDTVACDTYQKSVI